MPIQSEWQGTINGSVESHYNNDFLVQQRCVDTQNCIDFAFDKDNLLTQAGNLIINRNIDNGLITGTTSNTANPLNTTRTYTGFGELQSTDAQYNGNSLFQNQYVQGVSQLEMLKKSGLTKIKLADPNTATSGAISC